MAIPTMMTTLDSAIKTYQINYHLKVTGTLDAKTGTSMRSGKKRGGHGSTHTVATFLSSKEAQNGLPISITSPMVFFKAPHLRLWAQLHVILQHGRATHTSRSAKPKALRALKIGFGRGDHGDGANNAFDGPGKTAAHAFRPTDGRFHYDADETWPVVGAVPGGVDLETVALHEIGHLLGLGLSSVPGAIMLPEILIGVTRQSLHADDIQGIRALYNT
ncbi:hypothetical protein PRUPE_3G278100 [Prunus persica]|uniref:Peptidase metallopeptidase domain-containing protein n=1 Tax=Prunus persica TaxID=3760 RepID=A0A251Q7P5_PRUPE|nr:hypothetical protein PRUPE_3G278100 [Prunus persica]